MFASVGNNLWLTFEPGFTKITIVALFRVDEEAGVVDQSIEEGGGRLRSELRDRSVFKAEAGARERVMRRTRMRSIVEMRSWTIREVVKDERYFALCQSGGGEGHSEGG